MTITELIQALREVLEEHGDHVVEIRVESDYGFCGALPQSVRYCDPLNLVVIE